MTEQATHLRAIDAPHYNYWQALIHSFFNRKLYVDVGKRWKGLSSGYLLLLLSIVCIPIVIKIMFLFNEYFNHQLLLPLKRLPVIYIQNGVATCHEKMPYIIKNDIGEVIAIVDTSNTITSFVRQFPKLAILINSNKVMYRPPNPPQLYSFAGPSMGEAHEYVFEEELNQVIDTSLWVNTPLFKGIAISITILIYPTIVLSLFMVYYILVLVFALMAQLFSTLFIKMDLSYGQAFRLLMITATPSITILLVTFNWLFPMKGFLLVGLVVIYFVYAMISLKRESRYLVHV